MLIFTDVPSSLKTRVVNVATAMNPSLGQIKWHTHWRRYVFFPGMYTLFDVSCLTEIVKQIEVMMEARKNA